MIARLLVLACAVAALAILPGHLDRARDIDRAAALARGGPAEVAEARRVLAGVAGETDDTTPLVRRAQLELFARRPEAALTAARQATRAEPRNARAWLLVAQAAEALGDAAAADDARRRLGALVATGG